MDNENIITIEVNLKGMDKVGLHKTTKKHSKAPLTCGAVINAANFLQYPHNKHPIARPLGDKIYMPAIYVQRRALHRSMIENYG